MSGSQLRADLESLNKKFDILFKAFEKIVEDQLEEKAKIKSIFEEAKKEIENS